MENLHRQDLNPLEEAAAFQQLIEDFGYTQEQVAQRVGRSRSAVANLLRLFQLPPAVQRLVGEGLLTAGHAKALLGHPDRSYQEALAKRTVQEGLAVRDVEALVRERLELEAELGNAAEPGSPNRGRRARATAPARSESRQSLRPPGLLELEELLANHLDTRVSVSMSAKRGKVVIDFANLEDLERLYRVIIQELSRAAHVRTRVGLSSGRSDGCPQPVYNSVGISKPQLQIQPTVDADRPARRMGDSDRPSTDQLRGRRDQRSSARCSEAMMRPWSSSSGRVDPSLTTTAGARVSRRIGIRIPRTVPIDPTRRGRELGDDQLGQTAAAPRFEARHREVAGLDQRIVGEDEAEEDVGPVVVRRTAWALQSPSTTLTLVPAAWSDAARPASRGWSPSSMPRVMWTWASDANDRRRCSNSRTAVTGSSRPGLRGEQGPRRSRDRTPGR